MAASNGSGTTNTSGESNVGFDFIKKGGGDCISDKQMAEISRRIQGFIISSTSGDVSFSRTAPNSKLKLWVEISSTGAITGTVKRYNTTTGEWVDDHFHPESEEPPLKLFIKTDTIGSDDQVIQYSHTIGSGNYIYTVTPKSEPTVDSRWFQVSRDDNDLEIHYKDMAGVQVELRVLEYNNEV